MLINFVYHFVFLPNPIARLSSIGFGNRTYSNSQKVPVRLCSIAEPIELQSNHWVRLVFGSVSFD